VFDCEGSACDSASEGLRAIDCTACWRSGRRKRRRGRPSARTECRCVSSRMSSWPSSESGHPSSSASRMEWRWTSQQTPCWPLERARLWWGTQHVFIARAAARSSLLTACTEENTAPSPEIHDQVTQGSMWMCVCLCQCDTLPFGLTSRQC